MKKFLLSAALFGIVVSFYGCNSGGGSSSSKTQSYLPAGTYIEKYTNVIPAECASIPGATFVSDGKGNLCNGSNCVSLNVAANPCMNITQQQQGEGAIITWSNCKLDAGNSTLSANFKYAISSGGSEFACNGNVSLLRQP